MPARYLQTLAELATVKEYEPRQMIFETGHPAEGLYMVERARLVLEARWGCSWLVVLLRAV
jgi:hypothetical protein